MDGKIVTNQQEALMEMCLQVLAAVIAKMGGEVILSRAEIEEMFDIHVLARYISKDYVLLHLPAEIALDEIEIADLPEEYPQT